MNKFLENEDSENLSITNNIWWDDFTKKGIFWTNKSEFWQYDDDVFVNNDTDLYDLFKHKDTVAFLKVPQTEIPRLEYFIKRTGLKLVSESIRAEIETSIEGEYEVELTSNINNLLIYIFRYLYSKEPTIYKKSKEIGKLLELIKLKCYRVLDLHIKYTLQTESATKDEFLYLDKNKFYVKIDNLKDYERISIELSKMFESPKGLSDFIENLLLKPSDEKRAESLKVKKIGDLPSDELEWFAKNTNKMPVSETNPNLLDSDAIDEERNQTNDLVLEKDQASDNIASESNHQSNPYKKNIKDELSQLETKSSNSVNQARTSSTNYSDQNQIASPQNENAVESDWNPQVTPSNVESSGEENVIPKFTSSNHQTNKSLQANSTSSSERENNESNKDTLSQEAKRKIGRWGEEFAIKKLQEKFLSKYKNCELRETDTGFNILVNNQIKVEVKWLNKYKDQGIGRDVEYTENGEEYFIEVKATKASIKEIFQISRSEWQLAKEKQENYSIYRIYNAGTNQARPEEIRNPYKEWLEENLSIQSLTIKI